MSEVFHNVMYNVGDGINGGEDMNLVVSLINELIVKKYSEYIVDFVGILHNPSSGNLIFEFKLCKLFNFDISDETFVRNELHTIFRLVGLYEQYEHIFFWIKFDYYFVYNKE